MENQRFSMTRWLAVIALAVALCPAAWAEDPLQQTDHEAPQGVELSLLGGTVGWGAGAYWPVYRFAKIEATVGPFVAFGSQMAAAGLGAKFNMQIPVLESFVDFVAAGGAYRDRHVTFEVWVGKTLSVR